MPMPSNIYYWWNFGSLLSLCLIIQILRGLFLTIFYENNMTNSFERICHIERNINSGWLIRSLHANGASIFFLFIFLHIGRGLYFKSFYLTKVWIRGIIILFLLFATAFIGYVLPWGQISFWGATVITNLLRSIPYIGKTLTIWVWGNFSISKPTLIRFFRLHFILPFVLLVIILSHLIFLHKTGSNNPLGVNSNLDKISFQPFFNIKDLIGVLTTLILFLTICLIFPFLLIDPDNFTAANPLVTPPHIQPEWYFLFAYAILRSIPNKLGGVISLIISILIFILLPAFKNSKIKIINNKFIKKFIYFFWINNLIYLSLLGSLPIENPYVITSKFSRTIYFIIFPILIL